MSWLAVRKSRAPGIFESFCREPCNDCASVFSAMVFAATCGFQADEHAAIVQGRSSAATEERANGLHGRVLHDRLHDLLLLFFHCCKRNILRRFSRSHQLAGVLLREEVLRDVIVVHLATMTTSVTMSMRASRSNPFQGAFVELVHRIESALAHRTDPTLT